MSKKLETRKCVMCGKKFTPKSVNASVCGDKCRKALRAKHDHERKAKASVKKPVAKVAGKATEKIVLPKKSSVVKKPVAKVAQKQNKQIDPKFDTMISVKGNNPFKLAAISFMVFLRAISECENKTKMF